MSPPRKNLDGRSRAFNIRFALNLRKRLEQRDMTSLEFRDQLKIFGLDLSPDTVRKWLSGDRLPAPEHFETIGRLLWPVGDWKNVLPSCRE